MVKAPRSKGCRVCVQRRIKCDQTKPHCLRCQRANRECPGFETTKFVDEGPTLEAFYNGPSQGHSDASRSSSSSPQGEQKNDPSIRSSKAQQKRPRKRSSITPINAENWEPGDFERTAMINIICPTAYQNQILSDFIAAVRQPVQAPTFRCHSMWLRDVAACSEQSSCLTWAVRAISVAHLGRMTHDPNLIETSRRVYGKALLKLNDALQNPVEGLSSNTLSATMILSFYEVFNCTDRTSWIKHAGGAGHLIRLRGPSRHRSGTDRTIFIACRYSLIMESFQNRRACFLDAPEWRTLGWKIHQDLKRENPDSPFLEANEHFFQEIVSHPAYLRDAIDAVANPQAQISNLQELLTSGHAHRTKYQTIHALLSDELRAQGGETARVASSHNDAVFPIVYEYRDIHVASLYVGYWACLCAINISIIGLQSKLASAEEQQQNRQFLSQQGSLQSNPSNNPSSQDSQSAPAFSASSSQSRSQNQPEGHVRMRPLWDAAISYSTVSSNHTHLYIAENTTYAREICKSVEFMESTPFIGPLFLVLALRLALRMGISRREKEWVLQKLATIGENLGIAKSEVDLYWIQRSEVEAQGRGKRTGAGKGKAGGTTAYEEGGVLRGVVGSGVEMPGVGVVGFSEDDDLNEGGLDPAGPPVVPGDIGYVVAPVRAQEGSRSFGTSAGLGVEWQEKAHLWKQGGAGGGLSGA